VQNNRKTEPTKNNTAINWVFFYDVARWEWISAWHFQCTDVIMDQFSKILLQLYADINPFLLEIWLLPMGKQCRSRSACTSIPSDQDLQCLLPAQKSRIKQCRSCSDGKDVPADLDLHWLHVICDKYEKPIYSGVEQVCTPNIKA
jgi:hypothetical protein